MSSVQQELHEVKEELLKAVKEAKEDSKFNNLSYEKQFIFNKKVLDLLSSVTEEVNFLFRYVGA